MRITMEPEAAEHIRRKGGQLILFRATMTGCCGIGSVPTPMWEIGRPRRPIQEYRVEEIQGVTVYLDRALDLPGLGIHVGLDSVFGWRFLSLSPEGGLDS